MFARTFRPGKVQFATYAKKVVYHGLVSHCRRVAARERHMTRPDTQEDVARKATTSATSSGSPIRPWGFQLAMVCSNSLLFP